MKEMMENQRPAMGRIHVKQYSKEYAGWLL